MPLLVDASRALATEPDSPMSIGELSPSEFAVLLHIMSDSAHVYNGTDLEIETAKTAIDGIRRRLNAGQGA